MFSMMQDGMNERMEGFSTWRKTFIYLWVAYYVYMMLCGILIPQGSIIGVLLNGFIFMFCVGYSISRSYLFSEFGYVYLFLLLLCVLIVATSSNMFASFRMWMKYSISFLCLPIGFDLLSNNKAVSTFWTVLKSFLWLFVINYITSNVLHLGGSQYGSGASGVDMGNLFDDAIHTNLCVITILPFMLFLHGNDKKVLLSVLCVFSAILTVVLMKRMPIFCMALTIVCFVTLWYLLKLRYGVIRQCEISIPKRYVVLIATLIIGFIFAYQNTIALQYAARMDRFEAGLENEGRSRELNYIYDDIIYNNDDKVFFLGKETFNTVGTYANGIFGDRMIHENYGILLNGTGVIGTALYILINFYLLFIFFRYTKRVSLYDNPVARFLYIAYISLWMMFTLSSFSGTMWLLLYPSIHYLLSGMILRYFHDYGELDYTSD